MPAFLSQSLADLTRQLTFAPAERVRKQMDEAERLYWQIDPDRNYPLEFIIFRITRFRPDAPPATTLTGAAVRHDLLIMVEQLSEAVGDTADAYDPPPRTQADLCKQLRVSGKTISRYRRDGLFARRLIGPSGRKRLGFLPASVDRFLAAKKEQVEQAGQFTRIDEETRHAIVMRARRIRARVDASPYLVARHLSRKFGRTTEAVRQLLLRHDRHDPRVAIFPEHTPALSEKQQRVIYRAYRRGVSVSRLTARFSRSRNVIYRAINLRRAAALRALEVRYIASPTFDLPDAEQVILGAELTLDPGEAANDGAVRETGFNPDALNHYVRKLRSNPQIDAHTETSLFVRYNFLKYRAARTRDELSRHYPRSSSLDLIETYLRKAKAVKQDLVRSYLRLVVATARKHLAGKRDLGHNTLADLIGEGNVILVETIETFDVGRGNRFSTYLTWALMRRFARVRAGAGRSLSEHEVRTIGQVGSSEAGTAAAAMENDEQVAYSLNRLLGELDERERLILTRHFGLAPAAGRREQPQTLAEVASQLHISAERARRIEHRALLKLRRIAVRLDLPMPEVGADLLPNS